ncbi:hypothetical protein MMC17_003527 [Xylographa soralifera]|nr:hypothetical protein [Xylographa soralifera]
MYLPSSLTVAILLVPSLGYARSIYSRDIDDAQLYARDAELDPDILANDLHQRWAEAELPIPRTVHEFTRTAPAAHEVIPPHQLYPGQIRATGQKDIPAKRGVHGLASAPKAVEAVKQADNAVDTDKSLTPGADITRNVPKLPGKIDLNSEADGAFASESKLKSTLQLNKEGAKKIDPQAAREKSLKAGQVPAPLVIQVSAEERARREELSIAGQGEKKLAQHAKPGSAKDATPQNARQKFREEAAVFGSEDQKFRQEQQAFDEEQKLFRQQGTAKSKAGKSSRKAEEPLRKAEAPLRKAEAPLRKPEAALRHPKAAFRKPEAALQHPEVPLHLPKNALPHSPEPRLRLPVAEPAYNHPAGLRPAAQPMGDAEMGAMMARDLWGAW